MAIAFDMRLCTASNMRFVKQKVWCAHKLRMKSEALRMVIAWKVPKRGVLCKITAFLRSCHKWYSYYAFQSLHYASMPFPAVAIVCIVHQGLVNELFPLHQPTKAVSYWAWHLIGLQFPPETNRCYIILGIPLAIRSWNSLHCTCVASRVLHSLGDDLLQEVNSFCIMSCWVT